MIIKCLAACPGGVLRNKADGISRTGQLKNAEQTPSS